MAKLTVDAETRGRLRNLGELLEICDESGRTLGYFHPVTDASQETTERLQSPLTRDDLERRRQERTGRPLSDILDDLKSA